MTTVNFCPECDSLYFIQHNPETNILNYICKNCGRMDECTSHLIHENDFKKNHKLIYVEELIKNNPDVIKDPSIPKIHINCIKCNRDAVSLIKYDDTNLLFMYICNNLECGHYWTNTK